MKSENKNKSDHKKKLSDLGSNTEKPPSKVSATSFSDASSASDTSTSYKKHPESKTSQLSANGQSMTKIPKLPLVPASHCQRQTKIKKEKSTLWHLASDLRLHLHFRNCSW